MEDDDNKYLKTGVNLLDKHHEKLEEVIQLLKDDLNKPNKGEILSTVFFKLAFYIENYFTDEEMLFAKHGYPEFAVHKEEHNVFIENIQRIQNECLGGNESSEDELYDFMNKWYKNHIENYDSKATLFLKSKGL